MLIRRLLTLLTALVGATAVLAAGPVSLQSPDKVKNALRVLAYVQADMASKLPNLAYARLPHEVQEFQEAAPALTDALAGEPRELRSTVETQLRKAVAAAQQVESLSKTGDATKIAAAVAAVDAQLQALNQLFPSELRPVRDQLGVRPGMRPGAQGAGPPPDLR
ncbi:MAG: hypothetical protein ABI616_04695 [Pseudomonadota bacterium]